MNKLKHFVAAVTVILVAAALLGLLAGQTAPQKPGTLSYSVQTRPGAIPTSLTDIIQQDAYVCGGDIEGSGQTILLQDRQATPVPLLNNILGSSGNLVTWYPPPMTDGQCRWFPNGISWQASASGATGYLTIKCFSGPCKLVSAF